VFLHTDFIKEIDVTRVVRMFLKDLFRVSYRLLKLLVIVKCLKSYRFIVKYKHLVKEIPFFSLEGGGSLLRVSTHILSFKRYKYLIIKFLIIS
jgi:hypothetical protein